MSFLQEFDLNADEKKSNFIHTQTLLKLKIFLLNNIQQHIQKHVKAETQLGLFASVYLVHVQGIIRPSQQTEQVSRTKQETTQILLQTSHLR